jgi:hypothetical protein
VSSTISTIPEPAAPPAAAICAQYCHKLNGNGKFEKTGAKILLYAALSGTRGGMFAQNHEFILSWQTTIHDVYKAIKIVLSDF